MLSGPTFLLSQQGDATGQKTNFRMHRNRVLPSLTAPGASSRFVIRTIAAAEAKIPVSFEKIVEKLMRRDFVPHCDFSGRIQGLEKICTARSSFARSLRCCASSGCFRREIGRAAVMLHIQAV